MKKNVLTLFWITLLTLAGFPSCSDKENKGKPYATLHRRKPSRQVDNDQEL